MACSSLRPYRVAAIGLVLVISLWLAARALAPGPDWHTFYEASHYLVRGQSPYLQKAFANPPWALIPALPIALLLPEQLGRAAWFVAGIAGFAAVAYRLGAKPLSFGLFLAAPTTTHNLLNGNIDWLPLLGFTLPPQIGLLLVVTKPQIGLGIAIYWMVEAYRNGGIRGFLRLVYPTALAYLFSFLLYGFWLTSYGVVYRTSVEWNASFWPYTIPLGIGLMAVGIVRRKADWTYGAGPCLSPYVLFHVWNALLISFLNRPWVLGSIVVALWILVVGRL